MVALKSMEEVESHSYLLQQRLVKRSEQIECGTFQFRLLGIVFGLNYWYSLSRGETSFFLNYSSFVIKTNETFLLTIKFEFFEY